MFAALRCRAFTLDSHVLFQNLISALEQVVEAETEVSEVERNHDAEGWRQEIAALTKELDDLISQGTPAKTGGGGGAAGAGAGARGAGSSGGKRGRSSGGGGGASGGRASKKKKASESATGKARGHQAKRPRR